MHDLSPSPRRSIVASQPKQPKKSGAPKAKGAVRAKSGCYTCRIRRKKCDEQPNDDGRCQTCIRLRLQCLGFGQKRPEWLKENNNVTVFREKIKDFLAAQGMIKGHSGAGARASEQEATLVLVQEPGRSDSSSPPTPTLSASSDEHRYSGIATSNVRDGGTHYPTLAMPPQPNSYSSGRYTAPRSIPYTDVNRSWIAPHYMQDLSPDSPLDVRGGPMPPSGDLMFPSYSSSTPSTIMPPSSNLYSTLPLLAGSNNQSYHAVSYPSTSYAPQPQANQAFTSSLSASYQQQYTFDEVDDLGDAEVVSSEFYIPAVIATGMLPSISAGRSGFVRYYLDHVLMRQYLLADQSISEFIVRTIQSSTTACDAVCLLASLHQQSLSLGQPMDARLLVPQDSDTATYERICNALVQRTSYTEEEALTGLLVVSAFLFRGGRGAWSQFLTIASDWVDATLQNCRDVGEFLLTCTESQRFIIKTTFWFDILAATTRMQPPRFLIYYRLLWGRQSAHIDGSPPHPHLSMLTVMGCANATALAIAEIAALACWKERHTRAGTLSVPSLVERGRAIETQYLAAYESPVQPMAPYDVPLPYAQDEIGVRRRLTSNIFRAAAKVYLHNVLSGDHPGCPEIKEGVAETIQCLKSVPAAKSSLSSSVLRSVVFGVCLCGCLTDDWEEQQFILRRLEDEKRESAVGNSEEARKVMERVWERRRTTGGPVSWREVMLELGGELGGESLLLV
ncbi:hypothetical protein DENSPDRAFT_769670 [Dentipellis sp. KUC8613]|nr:hypothetical protein DENSPDRAFT_769670 [Dentipellis sp. KUC8613]